MKAKHHESGLFNISRQIHTHMAYNKIHQLIHHRSINYIVNLYYNLSSMSLAEMLSAHPLYYIKEEASVSLDKLSKSITVTLIL